MRNTCNDCNVKVSQFSCGKCTCYTFFKVWKVRCKFYDIDDKLIAEPILEPGDASFTLHGGHTYEILEEDTIVYEYKTGPYEGQTLDKVFINN